MLNRSLIKWEEKLDRIFDRIDAYLEKNFGSLYKLHPSRARRPETGNPEHDGLFQLNASFTAGFGSKLGPGYIVRVQLVTLESVDPGLRRQMEDIVAERLEQELPVEFPGRNLKVERDGNVYKIWGDLSLD